MAAGVLDYECVYSWQQTGLLTSSDNSFSFLGY